MLDLSELDEEEKAKLISHYFIMSIDNATVTSMAVMYDLLVLGPAMLSQKIPSKLITSIKVYL